jgi:hypothetical protein
VVRSGPNFYTDAVHIVERFALMDPNTMHDQATIDDPHLYTRPWTMAFPLRRNGPGFRLLENACHEGGGTRPTHWLQDLPRHEGARAMTRAAMWSA